MRKPKTKLATLLSGVVVAIYITFMIAACVVFIIIYKNSITESAKVTAEQEVSLVQGNINMNISAINQDFMLLKDTVGQCSSELDLKRDLESVTSVRNGVVAVMVYDLDGNMLCYGSKDGEMKADNDNDLSFRPSVFDDDEGHISVPHVQNMFAGYYPWVITIGYRITSRVYDSEVYLAMDVDINSVLSYIASAKIGQSGYCFVMDEYGNIVYHPQQQLIHCGLKEENTDMLAGMVNDTVVKGECIYSVEKLENYNWLIVGVSYTDDAINSKLHIVYQAVFWIAFGALVVLQIVIYIISSMVSNPVMDLTKSMRDFEQDAVHFKYSPVKGIYEVESLSNSFAHMVDMMQKLLKQIKDEEKDLRKTELKALQSQINPHFLYNTLDSIQWMCEKGDNKRAVEMVSALAKLFRISISKGREFIPIEQELIHVENYLIIQSFRFKDRFEYHIEVEGDVSRLYCNKITFQPIVENAIIHGVGDLCDDDGEIWVRAKVKSDMVIFEIEDNGIGMSEEQCKRLLASDAADNFGIGVKNVKDRLHIYFGNKAGLSIESEEDVGTKVTMHFPLLTETDLAREGLQ
jgi:two-component system sensor histidine kinase YesM